ncbi:MULTISPECIES: ROK family transcriptional regulator [unclassified Frigoribacterium]|uniref:ROK family transcriptional regulator n=1 Tax=unclassified Frigoribacterium TaxID=2627005 RepID=UPI000F4966D8|nr:MULTISPECIES: ROK family transcriptional regulator [unclassified Frigoribacterium]ROP75338.1 putative NBD/HSP70 family sugar kinase [Frigoribacterium sp. PhB107]TDT63893.1 putative NBD/HSP70 family sugar kinase [Frigoribacterium sp. PhB116]
MTTTEAFRAPPRHTPQAVEVLRPLRTGAARSRADLARVTGLSPSTVASRVEDLIRLGHVVETGEGASRGGRRPRRLQIRGDAGLVGCVDLGVDRASFGLVDFSGALLAERHVALDVAEGPTAVLSASLAHLLGMLDELGDPEHARLSGLSVGVPGPVSSTTARIVSPSRMPGWNGVSVAEVVQREIDLPVVVNNDANLMAAGELVAEGDEAVPADQVFVKVGSGIGCGIVSRGELYTGSNGWAGDISHVTVPGATAVPCSCGRTGCLDALASGNALVREMQLAGHDVATVEAMIDLARDAHPLATGLLRGAGVMTGGVLATIVNFFNPDRLVLGGVLADSDVFVAGVRSTLWADCLPMATDQLTVEVTRHQGSGGLRGAGRVFLDQVFSVRGLA